MSKPRIRHIALNVQDRDATAEYYKKIFGVEEKYRGPNGTVYLSDGFVGIALIHRPDLPWGINHFGFVVDDLEEARRRVERLGCSIHLEGDYDPGRRIYFFDPDGYEVELVAY